MLAAANNFPECVRLLIEEGADVNAQRTVIHLVQIFFN